MISFWEKKSFTTYDFIIIGSGIVGLSTAAAIKEKQPNKSVLVLERGIFPTGASTKNAGFACVGSLSELLDDLTKMSENEVLTLVEQRFLGLKKLRQRLGDDNIGYLELGSYELLTVKQMALLSEIKAINQMLSPIFSSPAFSLASEKNDIFGFNKQYVKGMISNNFEGQLDTGKMMSSLLRYVQQLGVMVLNGAEVKSFESGEKRVKVKVYHPHLQQHISFSSAQLAICTNAFSKMLLPKLDLTPGRGQVIVTKPIEKLPFKGIFHFDEGYYYFRNYGQRVIFGGGRNLDIKTEETTQFTYNQQILDDLKHKLQHIILPETPFEIDIQWTGIMGFGDNKVPIIKKVNDRIAIGVRMGGMGIAIGSLVGDKLADMLFF